MPYLDEKRKAALQNGATILTAGDLNYSMTRLVQQFVEANGLSYATLNDAIGALECCKLELYRRVVAPYEDTKIASNGDVY